MRSANRRDAREWGKLSNSSEADLLTFLSDAVDDRLGDHRWQVGDIECACCSGLDDRRQDFEHPDPTARELCAERPSERLHGGLRGRVHGEPRTPVSATAEDMKSTAPSREASSTGRARRVMRSAPRTLTSTPPPRAADRMRRLPRPRVPPRRRSANVPDRGRPRSAACGVLAPDLQISAGRWLRGRSVPTPSLDTGDAGPA